MSEPEVTVEGLGMSLGPIALGEPEFTVEEAAIEAVGSRYLDTITGDYATVDGTIRKASPNRQRVIVLLSTTFGTSLAVRGVKYPEYHDETTEQVTNYEIKTALEPLTSEGAIRLIRATVNREDAGVPGRLGIRVEYFDYAIGANDTVVL